MWPASKGDSAGTDNPPTAMADLVLTLTATKRILQSSEHVDFVLEIQNVGPEAIWLVFPTSCRVSYTVSAGGAVVYNRSLHQGCSLLEGRTRLVQGERMLIQSTWDQTADDGRPVPGGEECRIRAFLLTSERTSRPFADTTVVVERNLPPKKLTIEAQTDRDRYAPGDLANITIVITNVGRYPIEIRSPDSCTFWFYVLDADGFVVYSIPAKVACFMIISSFTLLPGGMKPISTLWDLHASNGAILAPGWYALYPTMVHAETDPDCVIEISGTSFFMAP